MSSEGELLDVAKHIFGPLYVYHQEWAERMWDRNENFTAPTDAETAEDSLRLAEILISKTKEQTNDE